MGKDNIGETCPLESSQRTQEGMDEMDWDPQVEQKDAQKAIEWARPLEAL